jgi:hypothetical protein
MARFDKACGAAILALVAATAVAQTPPDFSGRWTAPPPPEASGVRGVQVASGTMGSGWGGEITITQEASQLTVERAQFSHYDLQPPMRLTFALDGSESRNTINMGRGPQEIVSKAVRQENSVVITSSYRFEAPQGAGTETIEVRQVFSLDASGSLVITTTRGGLGGGPSSASTTTYKKNP